MGLIDDLLIALPDGSVESVVVGLHWTAVSVKVNGKKLCGLSSTVNQPHHHGEGLDVPQAGKLTGISALELAKFCSSEQPTIAGIGTAALNALLQFNITLKFEQINAEEIIAKHGKDKHVVIVGHFPFTERIRGIASRLDVLENRPQPGDLHSSLAPEVIPESQVVAITGMTFVNKTLEGLLSYCQPQAKVILLGASTPLHPVLFDYGIDYLCGALTYDIDAVLRTVAEAAVYRQIAKAGLNLVTASKSAH